MGVKEFVRSLVLFLALGVKTGNLVKALSAVQSQGC